MDEAMLELNNVSFQYEAQQDGAPSEIVLKEVSLSIPRGQFVAVLGHNGSGKSTMAKLFNASLLPTQGKAFVEGIDTADETRVYDIRQKVGMVFQNPDNQIVASIVEEDVAFGPENLGVPRDEIRRRVDEALKSVHMYEYRRQEPHKLSGGQKQRVAIAGIIAMLPDCIVLDEATAMLDPSGRQEVMQTVKRLNQEQGITVVFITHFMEEAVQADRVIVIDGGKILLDDTPRRVFSHVELLKGVGLDVPQSAELIYQLNRHGVPVEQDVLNAEDCIKALRRLLEE